MPMVVVTTSAWLLLLSFPGLDASRPNMVWFLTDDQDQELGASFPTKGGVTPMPKVQRLMEKGGVSATNWYIHTPICSPSRSELVTGRYLHNIKAAGPNGGGYCAGMHVDYPKVNNATFARVLSEQAGYTVGMFGKYLNEMPDTVPPGFDVWLANGGGDYIAPSFMTKNVAGKPDGHWKGTDDDYTTAVVGNASIEWIRSVVRRGDRPFFAYVAPKAAHEPFIPAPWHLEAWDASWPDHEPRTPNWNCTAESRRQHHGNIATQPMLSAAAADVITSVFKNRWRTLMSVDDLISDVISAVEELGQGNRTYFFYSSDHGFQLGQFNIPMDKRAGRDSNLRPPPPPLPCDAPEPCTKGSRTPERPTLEPPRARRRHVYTWDTRIHLLARGPGIVPGTSFDAPGTQVDLAPTFLGLAGLPKPPTMDGKSIAPFLLGGAEARAERGRLPASVRAHLEALLGHGGGVGRDAPGGGLERYRAGWREEVFIEYYFCEHTDKCVETCHPPHKYPRADEACGDLRNETACWSPVCSTDCYRTEDTSNNFIALRRPPGTAGGDTLYAEFQSGDLTQGDVKFDAVDFVEYYDVGADPWQMHNLASALPAEKRGALSARLHEWLGCAGDACP